MHIKIQSNDTQQGYIINMIDGKSVPFRFSTRTFWLMALASMKQNGRTLIKI
jgi:hypothetical protein